MKQVLLVEDNPGDIHLTRIAFEESGIPAELQVARSLAEARELLGRYAQNPGLRADLVLLDLNLGDGSGHDLLADIKASPDLADLPVVIVSTSAQPSDRARAAALGAEAYVVKPNCFDRFVACLQDLRPLLAC